MLPDSERSVAVQMGPYLVRVPEGGLYQRYQLHTDLDAVARDPRVPGVDFFRQLPKQVVQTVLGPSVTSQFYYSVSMARLSLLAPTSALRARLPAELCPLEVAPGLGLVAVMFYRYGVCDIDFYNEVALGVALRPALHGPLGAIDLAASLKNDHLHSYVLSLPVNTEIAKVGGQELYGLPKWVADIDIEIDQRRTLAQVANSDGGLDLSLSLATPPQQHFASGKRISSLTSYTQLHGAWHEFLTQTNILSMGHQLLPRDTHLHLGRGRLSDDLRSLKASRVLSVDVSTSCQVTLNFPIPIALCQ